MTYAATQHTQTPNFAFGIWNALVQFGHAFNNARAASAEAQRLTDMSDHALAQRGLTRDTIADHIRETYFAD